MKTNYPASDVLKPFTRVLTDAFTTLVVTYGGVQRLNDELARRSGRKVGIATLYRWYNTALAASEEINMSHVGNMLEVVLLVPNPDPKMEPAFKKLAQAILDTEKKP